jgi:ribosomal protein S18 acetylase RimI-like enzyme
MDDPLSIDVRPLTEERLGDYLRFFDEKAFTDNPRWASCYCYFPYHDPDKIDWQRRTGPENRTAISACVRDGTAQGYLAYAGSEVVGWCNAAPRRLYPMLNDAPAPDAETTGSIFCFIVAPAYRDKGIARSLLAAACHGLRARGMRAVEARPVKEAKSAAANHHGPLSLYLSAGFSVVREDEDGTVLVRKSLEEIHARDV